MPETKKISPKDKYKHLQIKATYARRFEKWKEVEEIIQKDRLFMILNLRRLGFSWEQIMKISKILNRSKLYDLYYKAKKKDYHIELQEILEGKKKWHFKL